jgi:phosphonate transport system ATP-binding protein
VELSIENLTKSYGRGKPVLSGLNLKVDGSGITSIIGSSGAGKSTLLRCINRLIEPDSGTVRLNDVELTALKGAALRKARRSIGMIFQSFNLLDRLTVMENVLAGRLGYVNFWQASSRRYPQADINRAYELLELVGMEEFVNQRASRLSGGQRQRVGVVRALMQQPSILLADEPTASLDPRTSLQIMELLQDIAGNLGLPVIINIHNVDQARTYTDRIVGLRYGHIIFDGTPADLDEAALDAIYDGKDWNEEPEEPGSGNGGPTGSSSGGSRSTRGSGSSGGKDTKRELEGARA